MGLVSLLTSVFVVVSTFVSSHVTGFLTPTSPTKNIEGVLSMDDTKEEIATDSSSAGSSSSNVVSNNSVIIDNGDSNVSIQINDNTTEGGLPLTNSSLDDWKYPNASVTSSSGNSMNLESSDNADAITNWYKGKISSLGMNVNSFVTTTTNNEVKNKLVGATNGKEVSIEISQPTANSKVSIKVSI